MYGYDEEMEDAIPFGFGGGGGFFSSGFGHFGRGRFEEDYRAYPVIMMSGTERENVNYGGKVILPPSALAKLASLNITYPMLFELINDVRPKKTHAGVLEFIAEEGRVYLPNWMMNTLSLEPGDFVQLKNIDLPLGKFVKIQPQSTDFLEITDPRAVLENVFRNFSTLTVGDLLSIKYNSQTYDILVMEVKPEGPGISIIETDLEVDFAPPVGYKEPEAVTKTTSMASSIDIGQTSASEPKEWSAFRGLGNQLNENSYRSKTMRNVQATREEPPIERPSIPPSEPAEYRPLNLPFGQLFFGFPVKQPKSKDPLEMEEKGPLFSGAGQILRPRKTKKSTFAPSTSNV